MYVEKTRHKGTVPNVYFLSPDKTFICLIIDYKHLCLIDKEDFNNVKQFHWGVNNRGYASTTINKKRTRLHEFITGWYKHCDHINRNSLDNRRCNLRYYEYDYQNMANQGVRKNNTTGYSGVNKVKGNSVHKIRYQSRVGYKRKRIQLGTFDTIEEAVNARNDFIKKHLGEFGIIQEVKKLG